jgi:hypothetical protein
MTYYYGDPRQFQGYSSALRDENSLLDFVCALFRRSSFHLVPFRGFCLSVFSFCVCRGRECVLQLVDRCLALRAVVLPEQILHGRCAEGECEGGRGE